VIALRLINTSPFKLLSKFLSCFGLRSKNCKWPGIHLTALQLSLVVLGLGALSACGMTTSFVKTQSAVARDSTKTAASGVPAKLVFLTQPASALEGEALAPAIRVSILDADGRQVANASNPVALTLQANPSSAALAGTTSLAATGGLATFESVSLDKGGTGYTLTATSPGLSSATSAAFSISVPLPSEQAAQADSFVDSVGVVTHLSYNNTPYYTAWPEILSTLETLGVRHIRDGFYDWASDSPYIEEHQQLAAAGIKCDYVVPLDAGTTPEILEQFASEVNDMEGLEAPNECDVAGNCGTSAAAGIANAVGFLPTIDAAARNLGMPVLGPSFTQQSSYPAAGNISSAMTYNNLHVYFGGRNPGSSGWGSLDPQGNSYGSFAWWLDQANIDAPNVPSVITETGYMSYPETNIPFTLPESVEASYTPRTLLLAFKNGIKRTYLYELLDEVSSPAYGLIHSDLTTKPAFAAVKNLISTLSDRGTAFTPGTLSYQVAGGDSTLNHLLLQKRDGSFWLVLWLEQSSFDPVSASPTEISPQGITLTLNSLNTAAQVMQFNDTGNMTTNNVTSKGATVPLTITDQLTIVHIIASPVSFKTSRRNSRNNFDRR
jgi:hypothetical protein